MIIDLHSHSNCSDGNLSPDQLLADAEKSGVELFAITDHDTFSAYTSFTCTPKYLQLVTGIEFSTAWEGVGVHIVGLNAMAHDSPVAEGAKRQTRARELRAQLIAEKLEKQGVANAYAGAQKYASCNYLGRPHFARFLVECGVATDIKQAFKRYLGPGKAGDIKHHWASMAEVIGWIKDSGGTAVLAHPLKYQLTRTKLQRLVADFIESGGEAIEVVSGQQKHEDTRLLAGLCRQQGLLASSGSDFHSPGQPWNALGRQPPLPDGCRPVWSKW